MDETEAESQDMGMPRSPFPERRLPGPPEDLPMDVELLKVLASDSRRDILQHLRKRRMTLTELSHALDLKKATVLEHLKKLTDAGLIRRLEDERLWVYYELTHRGGRVVNPSRTRFYLLMSVAAAAAVVLGGVAVALLATDLADNPLQASPEASATGSSPPASGGGGVSVDVSLPNAEKAGARAYLVSASDAGTLKDARGPVAGIPMALDTAAGDVVRFKSLSAVPPGDYYLYVVDAEGRDNLASLSEVRVPSLAAAAPSVLWKGLSRDADFALERDGAPADGTLLLVASEGRELPTLALANGTARLAPDTVDRLVPATYQLQFNPNGSQFWITLDRAVEVREPLWAVEPLYALAGEPTPFRVALAQAGDPAPPATSPELDGERPLSWSPTADGTSVHATFTPPQPGPADLTLGRLDPREVTVLPDLRLRLIADEDGDLTRLRVRDAAGSPVPEVAVGLDRLVLDLTNAQGEVAFPTPRDGAHELRLTLPDGTFLARALRFDAGRASEEPPQVHVRNVTAESSGGEVRAAGVLVNEGAAAQRATVALLVDGRTVATLAAEPPAGSALPVALSARVRLAPGEHSVSLVATPLRHSPIEGAAQAGNATLVAATPTPAASPGAWDETAGTPDTRYAYDESGDGAVRLTVDPPPQPTAPVVNLELRDDALGASPPPSGRATDAAAETQGSAKAPGPALALVLLGAAGVALALRRRRT